MAVGAASRFPLLPVAGVRLGSAHAGIRKPGRRDVVILELAPGSRVAGSFTRNRLGAMVANAGSVQLMKVRGVAATRSTSNASGIR